MNAPADSASPPEHERESDPAGQPDTAPREAASAGGGDAPRAEGEGPPRGERGRRRGRRDRHRGEGGESRAPRALPLPPNFEGPLPQQLQPPVPPEAGEIFAHVLSGEFDTESEAAVVETEEAVHKRVLAPEADAPKLHKVLAQAGVGSRRDMEDMIVEGRIIVNGEPAHTGQRISFGDRVEVDGKPVRLRIVPPPARIIAYHKPAGEIVTHDDPEHRPTVFRRLPRLQQGKWQSVGRLDINTEGLLLFTNSGGLANQLMHPRFGVEREYAVRVMGTLGDEQRAQLLQGVEVDGQRAAFKSIANGGGEGLNQWYRVVITEGRNREVRKLFDAVGLTVSRLIRIRYGTVVLPHGLKRGVWVDLGENDMRAIRRLASGNDGQRNDGPRNDGSRADGPRADERPDGGKRRDDRGPRGNPQGNGQGNNNQGGPRQRPQPPRRPDEARPRCGRGHAGSPAPPVERRRRGRLRSEPHSESAAADLRSPLRPGSPDRPEQRFRRRRQRAARTERAEGRSEATGSAADLRGLHRRRCLQEPRPRQSWRWLRGRRWRAGQGGYGGGNGGGRRGR